MCNCQRSKRKIVYCSHSILLCSSLLLKGWAKAWDNVDGIKTIDKCVSTKSVKTNHILANVFIYSSLNIINNFCMQRFSYYMESIYTHTRKNSYKRVNAKSADLLPSTSGCHQDFQMQDLNLSTSVESCKTHGWDNFSNFHHVRHWGPNWSHSSICYHCYDNLFITKLICK